MDTSLWGCCCITDIGLSCIGQGCPYLNVINLSFCYDITDIGISALGDGCPQLSELSLIICDKVIEACVLALIRCCPLLININIPDWSSASGQTLLDIRSNGAF